LKEKTAIASAAGVGDAADELGQPLSGEHVAIHRLPARRAAAKMRRSRGGLVVQRAEVFFIGAA